MKTLTLAALALLVAAPAMAQYGYPIQQQQQQPLFQSQPLPASPPIQSFMPSYSPPTVVMPYGMGAHVGTSDYGFTPRR
jgi:hypothetical protein